MARRAPLKRYSALAPGKPMARKPLKRKSARRLARRAALSPLLAFVRRQDCLCCGRKGPSDPAHMTLSRGEKGVGMKTPDTQAVPLCRAHHRAWDQHTGRFAGWSDDERYALASTWVDTIRMAVTPDCYDKALLLEAAGLGTVERDDAGEWVGWLPAGVES